jgi:hypothetical protein
LRFRSALLLAAVVAPISAANPADKLDESQAIREIERLGGTVVRDDKLPGRPITQVRFGFKSDFGDEHVQLRLTTRLNFLKFQVQNSQRSLDVRSVWQYVAITVAMY